MSEHWVLLRKASYRFPLDCFLVLEEGSFAYPKWRTNAATVLGKSEAHQYGMCFGTGDFIALEITDPRVAEVNPTFLAKWRAKTARELREEARNDSLREAAQ